MESFNLISFRLILNRSGRISIHHIGTGDQFEHRRNDENEMEWNRMEHKF